MSGNRHGMSDAEWDIFRSILSHKCQGPEMDAWQEDDERASSFYSGSG